MLHSVLIDELSTTTIRKWSYYLSTNGGIIGLINFSDPDQRIVCTIISSMFLVVYVFI